MIIYIYIYIYTHHVYNKKIYIIHTLNYYYDMISIFGCRGTAFLRSSPEPARTGRCLLNAEIGPLEKLDEIWIWSGKS